MTTLCEGNLQITFPQGVRARKFDDPKLHGLSHCMKAVDFLVEEEEPDRVSFIEIKDPDHPNPAAERSKFIKKFLSGNLDEDLKYKYRDTFLYQWAAERIDKPIYYWVIIALDELTEVELSTRTDNLKRKLPLDGPSSGQWKRPFVTGCMVFNFDTWNRHWPRFPLKRIS